ncbi:MAG: hypothetical protein AAFZ15_00315 [Bacteroidota bacterium]
MFSFTTNLFAATSFSISGTPFTGGCFTVGRSCLVVGARWAS